MEKLKCINNSVSYEKLSNLVSNIISNLQLSVDGSSYGLIYKNVINNIDCDEIDIDFEIKSVIANFLEKNEVLFYKNNYYHIEELFREYKMKSIFYKPKNFNVLVLENKLGQETYEQCNKILEKELKILKFIEGVLNIKVSELDVNDFYVIQDLKVTSFHSLVYSNSDLDNIKKEVIDLGKTFEIGQELIIRSYYSRNSKRNVK